MKYPLIKTVAIYLLTALPLLANAATQKVSIKQSVLVGDGIAKFIPEGFDAKKIPSFAIEKEPREKGTLPTNWILIPEFSLTDGKANASLTIPEGTSIYGGGEVTGSLLRNGKTIKLWNTDSGAYGVDTGTENDVWVKTADGKNFHGDAWPGAAAFPDFTCPKVNKWWRNLYKDFMAQGVDGVWNDVNEPQINDTPNKTMPEDNLHRGGGKLPAGTHLQYHNVYGFLMVKASREGIMEARPERRPFILTRSNFLGGQRYAATWTGDNGSWWDHLKMSIPMSLTLGLSGQPFSGSDIGGFLFNADADLFGNWIGVGAFYPFSRGHACAGTNNKEPWAFGQEVENAARIALERRYMLLPYYYTLLHEASTNGMPIMRPVFFADPKDLSLRAEEEAFLIGDNLLIIPAYAKQPALPKGIWKELSLVKGDNSEKYQAKIKIRGGSIIPTGKIIQNTTENSLDPLTLLVCLDEQGKADGSMYWDAGDGWAFKKGDYSQQVFKAEKQGDKVIVKLTSEKGKFKTENKNMAIVKVITDQGVCQASGSLVEGIEVKL